MSGHYNPTERGLHAVYRSGEINHCPGCGRSQWIIGRTTAECAYCSSPLDLEATAPRAQSSVRFFGKGGGKVSRMMAA